MKQKYKVTAHHKNAEKTFSLTFEAETTNHAGALFVSEMDRHGTSVLVDRLVGEQILLSETRYPKTVILDRIEAVCGVRC